MVGGTLNQSYSHFPAGGSSRKKAAMEMGLQLKQVKHIQPTTSETLPKIQP